VLSVCALAFLILSQAAGVPINPFIKQQKLLASDGGESDFFGGSVAVSGNTAIVGAFADDHSNRMNAGSAYVFERRAGVWREQQHLKPSDVVPGHTFGSSVAISGDTAIVGKRFDDIAERGQLDGSAYVFQRSAGVWREQQKLRGFHPVQSGLHLFGGSVAISGDTAIVGAVGNSAFGCAACGAYIFERRGGVWSQQQQLQGADVDGTDRYGNAVAISGDTAIVGSFRDDHSGGMNSGSAYVFTRSGSTWVEQQRLQATTATADENFGLSVAINGDTAIIGSGGSAYVFERRAGVWREQQRLRASDLAAGSRFGYSVSISGDVATAGVAGSAYVFERRAGAWSERQKFQKPDGRDTFAFSFSNDGIAVSGDTIIVGAATDNSRGANAGSAYIFNDPTILLAGQVIISEFRLSGPGAGTDEFVELYNTTYSDITVSTTDGSAGWTLRSSDGTLNVTIPNGARLPARGHFLVANFKGYSLAAYPTNTHGCPGGNCAFADLGYNSDTPDNTGLALFRTAHAADFNSANRLDAAGPADESDPLYREGAGYAPLTGGAGRRPPQHSFVRKPADGGAPADGDDNARDFRLVATDGAATLPAAALGAPGPENSYSPVAHNATVKASLMDRHQFSDAPPNRLRNAAADAAEPAHSPRGTLKLRRKFTNRTGRTVTRLRFRVADITTAPRPDAATADLRVLHASGGSVNLINGTVATLTALVREEPPAQAAHGGGFNTTLSAVLAEPVAPGESVNVEFNLGVVEEGQFRFVVNVEARFVPETDPPGATKATSRPRRRN
jgi:hypothetical protein